ncbi:Uu.00g062780.m01.CDS01 [Anthostomella pinea]|uniref:Succinate dehydrogenase assembly factor 4, mitochondrial n=1 Tax=Anthostomella pinea TaxID=933095 RepID=A0AAI8YMX1_9PEZI|nr:Uu.00g062780.m01.CDS01 [Anthostomella pinea]
MTTAISSRLLRLARPALSHYKSSAVLLATRQPPMSQNQQNQHVRYASSFESGPAPPRLPPKEQAEFERLQRTANTQEGFNPTSTPDFSSPSNGQTMHEAVPNIEVGEPNAMNTPLRKGAPPEFEGETNPQTGEVGGPKNEPLRWGAGGDYSYNGRVTDF